MARYSQTSSFGFYQPSPTTVDAKPAFSEDEEMSILDDKILDPTSPEISSLADRRTSYDIDQVASDSTAHRDSAWSDYSHSLCSTQSRHNSHAGHAHNHQHQHHNHHDMFESSNDPSAMRVEAPAAPSAFHQGPWSLSRHSGSCTPTALYEPFACDYDNASSGPYSGGAVGPVSAINVHQMAWTHQGLPYFPHGAAAMSPQSSHGWMPTAPDMSDGMPPPAKSPTYRNDSPLSLRRDGIRKKNARFEIPAERTLSNIDQLISQSTNEDEIKELKQQKRLLRNRQAALDSRQRKKLHTEKLEEEKKHYTQVINELEEALQSMKIQRDELMREKSDWVVAQQQVNQYVDGLHMERDELIRVHTLETAELRKKNNILKETVDQLERQVKTSTDAGMSTEYSDFDTLTMDCNPWDDFTMVNGLSLESEPVSAHHHPLPTAALTTTKATDKTSSLSEHPFSWNAFYMCLLFGAFIASNSGSLPSRSIPQLSEEYRAESANVLKAVLASAPPELAQSAAHRHQPAISATAASLPTTISGAEMARMTGGAGVPSSSSSSTLDELHSTLVMPSKRQEREQAFALTAEQYNSLTTLVEDDEMGFNDKPQQPSNLQQALANMRSNVMQQRMQNRGTSDVYSRSLMWDRVPEKVIRDFRRMVQEYGSKPVKEESTAGFGQP